MQGPNEYNFIYNDGDFQIQEEEILGQTDKPTGKKYYRVDKNYHLEASFKDKKEALLYVGWRNTRALKELKDLKDTKESLASDTEDR